MTGNFRNQLGSTPCWPRDSDPEVLKVESELNHVGGRRGLAHASIEPAARKLVRYGMRMTGEEIQVAAQKHKRQQARLPHQAASQQSQQAQRQKPETESAAGNLNPKSSFGGLETPGISHLSPYPFLKQRNIQIHSLFVNTSEVALNLIHQQHPSRLFLWLPRV